MSSWFVPNETDYHSKFWERVHRDWCMMNSGTPKCTNPNCSICKTTAELQDWDIETVNPPYIWPTTSVEPPKPMCTCDSRDLFNLGCKCGYLANLKKGSK